MGNEGDVNINNNNTDTTNNERMHLTFVHTQTHTSAVPRVAYLSREMKHDELRRVEPGLGVAVALAQVGVVVKLQTGKNKQTKKGIVS